MSKVRSIKCVCSCGLGTSVLWEMNTKRALEKLGIHNVIVDHCSIKDAHPGDADLYICSEDLYEEASKLGEAISIENMMLVDEYVEKLKVVFG